MKFIDLHVHSNVSDGSCTPTEVVTLAKKRGLSALTLSDHESIAGNDEAAAKALALGLEFIPGMEMTVDYKERKLHIVALGFDASHPAFQKLYGKIRKIKEGRMQELIEGIGRKNIPISADLIEPYAVIGKIDRYAIMRYLVSLNLCNHVQPLWDNYINPTVADLGLNYNVPAAEALPAIREAGGVTSLAHFHKPLGLKGLSREEQIDTLGALKVLGLTGMEAYYPNYTQEDQEFSHAMIKKYDFLPTGGTDFHGDNRPGVKLGTGIEHNISVPYRFYEAICRRCQGE